MYKIIKDRIDRRVRMINTYKDLLSYWSYPYRMIGQSTRLNQSAEFIKEQIEHCKTMLVEHTIELSRLNKQLELLNEN